MISLDLILAGFTDAITVANILYIIMGVAIGQLVGAIPGIGPVMVMAIVIPFTFTIDPLMAISFLVGINKGGLVGGAIPAILMNTPGTPDAAPSAFDGYPLAKQGKPMKATKMALFSSVTGDTFSDIALITLSIPLAMVALKMGSVEIFTLIIFSFSVIVGLLEGSIAKGAISMFLGMLVATVGLEAEYSTERLIFGFYELYEGIPIVPIVIGMLAMPQILIRLSKIVDITSPVINIPKNQPDKDKNVSWAEYWSCRFAIARGSLIGLGIGAIPGIGSVVAAFMSYSFAKASQEKNETKYGEGNIKGIAATESANSAVMGANLIPLFSLGIPGSISAALLIGAFMIHGLVPGPEMFEQQGQLVYAIFGAMLVANVTNLIVGYFGMRIWIRAMLIPETVIFSFSFILCIIGTYLSTGSIFSIVIMFIFAILGILMQLLGFSRVIFLIAFVLEKRLEETFIQAMGLLDGNILGIIHHPIAMIFLILSVCSVYYFGVKRKQVMKNEQNQ